MTVTTALATLTIVLFIAYIALGFYLRHTSGKPSIHKQGNTVSWASAPCIKPDHICVTTPTGERLHINYNDVPVSDLTLQRSTTIRNKTYNTYKSDTVFPEEGNHTVAINKPAGAKLRHIHFGTDFNKRAYVTLSFAIGSNIMPREEHNVDVYLQPKTAEN